MGSSQEIIQSIRQAGWTIEVRPHHDLGWEVEVRKEGKTRGIFQGGYRYPLLEAASAYARFA